jgi:Sin3 histone deacetylase corepressor complex component SDS3
MTRKLRRRPNDPVPIPEKRRKPPPAQLNYLLDEKEIEGDLKVISRGKLLGSVRKPGIFLKHYNFFPFREEPKCFSKTP